MKRSLMKMGLVAALLASSACVSVLPEQKVPDALYEITARGPQKSINSIVVVREPEAARLVSGRSIATETSDGAFMLLSGVEWAERSTRMIQMALLDSFERSAEGAVLDDGAGVSGDYELSWRLAEFTTLSDAGRCRIELTLLDGGDRSVVAAQSVVVEKPATGSEPVARTRALAEAASDCVRQSADFVSANAVAKTGNDDVIDD